MSIERQVFNVLNLLFITHLPLWKSWVDSNRGASIAVTVDSICRVWGLKQA